MLEYGVWRGKTMRETINILERRNGRCFSTCRCSLSPSLSFSLSLFIPVCEYIYGEKSLVYRCLNRDGWKEPGHAVRTSSWCIGKEVGSCARCSTGKVGKERREKRRKENKAERRKRKRGEAALRGFIPFHLPVFEHFLREVRPENRATKITKPGERERKLGSRVRADL